MYKREGLNWLKHRDFMLIDFILIQIAFVCACILRNGWVNPYDNNVYRGTAFIIGLLDLCVGFFGANYSGILRRGYWREFKAVFRQVIIVVVGTIAYLFVTKSSTDFSRLVMIYMPVFAIILSYIGRIMWKHHLKTRVVPNNNKRGIALVVGEDNYQSVINRFADNPYSEFKVVIAGVMDNVSENSYKGVNLIKKEEEFLSYIQDAWVDEILFCIPEKHEFPEELLDKCNEMGITIHIELTKLESDKANQIVEIIEGYTVLSTSVKMVSPQQVIYKRAIDLIGAVIGLVLTGVLFIFIAPCIYIKSPGPIFFAQERVGKNGRIFKLYKFRSMYMDAEERKKELMEKNNINNAMMFKMQDDPRIIKGIGNFIRDYSLDEFPQFYNVLKGDMSLVGTRPPTIDEWNRYECHHRKRLAVKPGITGLWQVSGRSSIVDFEEVVKLDTKYIRDWDIGMDIRIILKTIAVVLKKDGAM